MKTSFFKYLLIYLACASSVLSQTKTDSLLGVLARTGEDTNKVKILNSLSVCSEGEEETLNYADRALTLAEKLNYKKGIINALNQKSFILVRKGQNSEAMEIQKRILKLYEESGSKKGIAYTQTEMGRLLHAQGKPELALECFMDA